MEEADLAALVESADRGESSAAEPLFAALYSELRRIARYQLARQGKSVTISPTTLLHEAFLNLAGKDGSRFPDRARFMAYTAKAMRTFIIDHAREKHAQKRGGMFEITSFSTENMQECVDYREVSEVGSALEELAKVEPELAEGVDLKFFCGLSFAEIAAMRDVSERTIQRNWEKARLFLRKQIRQDLKL